ncbi:MAG: hypothetical protein ACI92E_002188 [Oceanicoccus sp.]|jgi:hypothetical protein
MVGFIGLPMADLMVYGLLCRKRSAFFAANVVMNTAKNKATKTL